MATFISMLVTDFFLLVAMLVGLLRIRHRGAGAFALGRLLWKQVGWWYWFLYGRAGFLLSLMPFPSEGPRLAFALNRG